jgi:hypothetical protein
MPLQDQHNRKRKCVQESDSNQLQTETAEILKARAYAGVLEGGSRGLKSQTITTTFVFAFFALVIVNLLYL